MAEDVKTRYSDEELEEGLKEFADQMKVPVEFVKARIPVEDYRTDMRVQKAVELVKNNAVVDNDMPEAAEAEETTETAE